ncbi:MAG: HD domain-containing protein [Capsulimonadaceae bacterium]|nr:HD domain-containing protein [Capsulimonadaceae bacterium]
MLAATQIPLELQVLTELKEIGRYVRERREVINSSDRTNSFGPVILEQNTDLIDQTLCHLFNLACARVPECHAAPPELAIVATGGYGRRELAPFSDIDVTFIPAREEDDVLNAIIKDMFQALMDVFMYGAGMKVGYAYRLFSDLGQLDHQTQTALLDMRLVVGDEILFSVFQQAYRDHCLVLDFLHTKHVERLALLNRKGGDNVYVVEPDIKESAGGLRDAQCVEWYAEVLFGCSRHDAIPKLVERGILSALDASEFQQAYEFLFTVRTALHCLSQEARDVLSTERQEAVALHLQYADTAEKPAVEVFMSDYYMRTALIQRTTRKVGRRCLDSLLDLGVGGLASENRAITIVDYEAAEKDDAMPFHAVELAQAYELHYSEQFIEDEAAFIRATTGSPNVALCARVFNRILQAPHGVAKALRDLADSNCIDWLIPEFGPLRTLIPYDPSHDYTVGEHSLIVVEYLEELRHSLDVRNAEYQRAWNDVTSPEVLYLAGLIHDIGKQWPQKGAHADSGAEVALTIAKRLGWDGDRTAKLEFLVRNHLVMAEISRLRDLSLDETIREFTRIVTDTDLLNMLYCLTWADTHAVGSGIWTEMKSKFLGELFGRAQQALTAMSEEGASEEQVFNYVPDLAKHRERLNRQLSHHNLPQEAIHEHTVRMPAQYLLNTPLEEMYLHMAMINRLRATGLPTVDFKTEFGADYSEMAVVTYDDPAPGLLAKIVGVLYALDLNIHGSQVFTRESSVSIAIDTLWVDYRGKPLSTQKRAEVQETLRNVLTRRLYLPALFEKRRKPSKQQVIHRAVLDSTSSDRYSLLEVRAPDEPGVLYRLTSAISGLKWNIHSARVSVWGSRVRAAFYVTDVGGGKIPDGDIERLYGVLPREEFTRRKIGQMPRV